MDGTVATVDVVAAMNDYHPAELERDLNRQLQRTVFQDYAMAPEFRVAMLRLCQAEASPAPEHLAAASIALRWLILEARYTSELRIVPIFQRIARHNARFMLYSLAHWVRKVGMGGLIIGIDVASLTEPRNSLGRSAAPTYYRTAILDTYEVLRQLIDATNQLAGTMIVVAVGSEFLTDPYRELDAYQALRLKSGTTSETATNKTRLAHSFASTTPRWQQRHRDAGHLVSPGYRGVAVRCPKPLRRQGFGLLAAQTGGAVSRPIERSRRGGQTRRNASRG